MQLWTTQATKLDFLLRLTNASSQAYGTYVVRFNDANTKNGESATQIEEIEENREEDHHVLGLEILKKHCYWIDAWHIAL